MADRSVDMNVGERIKGQNERQQIQRQRDDEQRAGPGHANDDGGSQIGGDPRGQKRDASLEDQNADGGEEHAEAQRGGKNDGSTGETQSQTQEL